MQSPSHDVVERLAYQFWLDRGSPRGTPDEDWFRAERHLTFERREDTTAAAEAPLSNLAKEIGSALGSIAALAANAIPTLNK